MLELLESSIFFILLDLINFYNNFIIVIIIIINILRNFGLIHFVIIIK